MMITSKSHIPVRERENISPPRFSFIDPSGVSKQSHHTMSLSSLPDARSRFPHGVFLLVEKLRGQTLGFFAIP